MTKRPKPIATTRHELEKTLIAAAQGPRLEISIADLRKRGLLTLLREWQAREKPKDQ